MDSTDLEKYLAEKKVSDSTANQIRDFYKVRNYQYAWFTEQKVNEQAVSFWNLQSNYIELTGDSSIFNPFLQSLADTIANNGSLSFMDSRKALPYELELTRHFFVYATKAYAGSRDLNPADLKWFIPRRKTNVRAMLDSLMSNAKNISSYEPVNRQYGMLRKFLVEYNKILQSGGWKEVNPLTKKLEKGDSAAAIAAIKRRLHLVGDYLPDDTSHLFDDSLLVAVKRFQSRFGLSTDGVIGGNTLRKMNESLDQRIRQILVNMERVKWMPAEPQGDYILVNIPAFKLFVYEKGDLKFNMNVVVGSQQHHTVIFTGKLKHVVFSPYWNVPNGILKNEILPAIRRDPNYLAKHDMEWYDGRVRQKPGPRNSLGLVKFLFPNNYNIYLHDTPSKSLFNETRRAFSHGCIRISEPQKMAEWILRDEAYWDQEKIVSAMHAGKEKWVGVAKDVNVFIGYFTAWVDAQGNLNFRDDVYGHDKVLGEAMFGEVNSEID
jgi:murein L,D-transpeptidase YcbB/YkuD